jgi:Na+(H+)/acetate symporter ActP
MELLIVGLAGGLGIAGLAHLLIRLYARSRAKQSYWNHCSDCEIPR